MPEDAAVHHPDVRLVAYGRPATEALATAIEQAKAGHPLDPVTVLVASNLAGLSVRRLIGGGTLGGHGLANVSFVTPLRLAELVAGDSLEGFPLTNAVLAAAARRVLRRHPEPFQRVSDHHASEAAVVALYAELSRLRPSTLARLEARDDRTAALVRISRSVRAELGDRYYDEDERAATAAERLRHESDRLGAQLGRLIWFLPDRLTPAQTELVAAALAAVPATVVVGRTGIGEADEAVLHTCREAGVEVDPRAAGVTPPPAPTGTDIVSVSDPDEEVRIVCREVMALAEAGTPLDRIGVFHPAPDPYARTLAEQLGAAGIPHNGPSRLRLSDRVAGRILLAALGLPDRGWARADVLALASDGPVVVDGELVPSGAWERLSRAAGVVAGLDDWVHKLEALAAEAEATHAERSRDPEAASRYLEGLLDDVRRARALDVWVTTLADVVAAVDDAAGWAAKVEAAQHLLQHLLGPEGRRQWWPEPELAAADRVAAALARLTALDELDPDPTTATFLRAVGAELEEGAGRSGRFGEGVLFGPLAMAAGLDLDAVFVVGMAEGTCPRPRSEDALLPDDVRSDAGGELLTRDEGLRQQHRQLLSALAAGGQRRVLCFPRGDLRGNRTRLPSRWLLDTATALDGGTRVHSGQFAGLPADVVREVASFSRGLVTMATAASPVEHALAALHRFQLGGGDPADHPAAAIEIRRGLAALAARRSERFTEWDGNLAGVRVPSPSAGTSLSATSMQSWAECGFKYFLGKLLHLVERPEPEATTSIGAADRGTLLHEVLERFIGEVIDRPGGAPEPGELWTAADRARVREIAGEVFERFHGAGRTGRDLLWRLEQRFLLDDLDAFLLRVDPDNRLELLSTPVAVELAFGLDDAPPLTLDVGRGRALSFKGRIDRVDTTEDGGHVVFDYKSGKGGDYKELAADPVRAGRTLQLGLYAEAVRQQLGADEVGSYFWMVSSRGEYRRYGGPWTADDRARFLEVLAAITDGIEAGAFPARPGEFNLFWRQHDNCSWCDFDALCPRDRDEHERAKADAPELAVLRRLEPADAGGDPG